MSVFEVEQFVEKPSSMTARHYFESSGYAWNSGIFIWRASTILRNFERFLPRVYGYLKTIASSMSTEKEKETIRQLYEKIPSISIDYGILERSGDVEVVLGDFGWSDVGSWDSLGALYEMDASGNITKGDQINIGTKNCISYTDNRLIATIGIENMIIVAAEDAVLVCHRDQAQNVKEVVEKLKEKGLNQYLL